MEKFPEVSDLEVERLRQEISQLKEELLKAQSLLKENGLIDKVTKVSDAEQIAIDQLSRLKYVSDSGLSFDIETTKIYSEMVKTLMLARGKTPVEEKKKEKHEKIPTATLLNIAGNKKFERD